MREWFTARELAGTIGLPATVQGVNHRARREGWPARRRKGRGGGREYPLEALPAETRLALLGRTVEARALRAEKRRAKGAEPRRFLLNRRELRALTSEVASAREQIVSLERSLGALLDALARAADATEGDDG